MKPSALLAAVAWATFVILAGTAAFLSGAVRVDTEDNLQARIQREQDPVKKAKYEIRLAHLRLLRGEHGCEQDDHEVCHQSLGSYLDLVQASWNGLESSGRRAVKQPSGFKELDIALREDARGLQDSERHVPFEDRDYIESVVRQINALREKVIAALFPAGGTRSKEGKPAPPEAHFAPGRGR